jgi:hypothetical protein
MVDKLERQMGQKWVWMKVVLLVVQMVGALVA